MASPSFGLDVRAFRPPVFIFTFYFVPPHSPSFHAYHIRTFFFCFSRERVCAHGVHGIGSSLPIHLADASVVERRFYLRTGDDRRDRWFHRSLGCMGVGDLFHPYPFVWALLLFCTFLPRTQNSSLQRGSSAVDVFSWVFEIP